MKLSLLDGLMLPEDLDNSSAKKRVKYRYTLAVQQAYNELEEAMKLVLKKDCSGVQKIYNEEEAVRKFEKAKSYDFAITYGHELFSSHLNNLPFLNNLLNAYNRGFSSGKLKAKFAQERIRSTHSFGDNPAYDLIQDRNQKVLQIPGYLRVYSRLVKMSSVNTEVVSEPLSITK